MMIISIEGPDFVGKNTVIDELKKQAPKNFQKMEVQIISFPNTDTEIGRICRTMLKNTSEWTKSNAAIFQLLNTAHRYEYYAQMQQAKASTNTLLFIIRYNLSGPVYAAVDGLNATKTWQLYDWFEDVLPDFTFILFRDYDFSSFQSQRNAEHYETQEKQRRVRELFQLAPTLWNDRLGSVVQLINEEVHETVKSIMDSIRNRIS